MPSPRGFTLVELIVVITIIVVLVSLLTPALDNAVYQAELAQCAGQVKVVVTSANLYALDHGRRYPHRKSVRSETRDRSPFDLIRTLEDDRPAMRGYFDLNGWFNDPFSKPVDLEETDPLAWVLGSYAMWFGYGYTASGGRGGMFRMGDSLEFNNDRFDFLVTDQDVVAIDGTTYGQSSHPDRDGVWFNAVIDHGEGETFEDRAIAESGLYVFSRWQVRNATVPLRGDLDLNYGRADGSVERETAVPYIADATTQSRFAHLPLHANGANAPIKVQLPRH